jgi:hypothetical protein
MHNVTVWHVNDHLRKRRILLKNFQRISFEKGGGKEGIVFCGKNVFWHVKLISVLERNELRSVSVRDITY